VILALASGKGGTGKTTVAVNLARVLGSGVQLLDCDVEEPNCHLFLKGVERGRETVTVPIPVVDENLCDACGECSRFCAYHAIAALETKPLVFPDLCHSCGGCMKVCPPQAIRETERRIGVVETFDVEEVTLIEGRLDVGVARATRLIQAVKARLTDGTHAILDVPPGTSCPVIAAVRGADFVLLVTEPTPFGLHDLRLAAEMLGERGIPCGVVVNRVGAGDDRVHTFCAQEDIPILLEIPDDRRIAEVYSRGHLIIEKLPGYRRLFENLLEKTLTIGNTAGA